jgi:putative lipoic acid-binding regulatory protein
MMVEQEPPKIEFPCDYPIKIIGRSSVDFRDVVVGILKQHDPLFDESTVNEVPSGKGTFVSVRVVITATGEPQIKALLDELLATGQVKAVI